MIVGSLDWPETYASLLTNDAWGLVFEWASAVRTRAPEDGEYPLRDRGVCAIVQTVQAKERSEGVFEAHRREVDVHVCLDGSEVIEVAPVSSLRPRTEYDAKKDYTLYDIPDSTRKIKMTPGTFAVFFPEDGHMPGLKFQHPQTRKIVFKVRRDLV